MSGDRGSMALVRALALSLSPWQRYATSMAIRHWMDDPMACVDIAAKEPLRGPYTWASLMLESMGLIGDSAEP